MGKKRDGVVEFPKSPLPNKGNPQSLERQLSRVVARIQKRDGMVSAYHKVADLAEKMRRDIIPKAS